MIKINPCAKCRKTTGIVRWVLYPDSTTTLYSTSCSRCRSGKDIRKPTREEADAAWNAANPVEQKEEVK